MNHEIGKMLTKLRHERGLSQKRAADDLGISQALLSHYENGVREPKLDFLIRASQYYDVTTDYLLGISPHRQPSRLPEIREDSEEHHGLNIALVVHSLLEEIGDERLSALAWEYVSLALHTVLLSLRQPDDAFDPLSDAVKKRALGLLLARLKELSRTPGALPEFSDQILRQWYPEEYPSLRYLEERARELIEALTQDHPH